MINQLKNIAEISSGFAFKSSDFSDSNGIPVVRISNINSYAQVDIDIQGQKYYPFDIQEKLNKFLVRKGDVLIALSGATTGKIGIYNSERQALLNQRVALIRGQSIEDTKYLYYALLSKSKQILDDAYGGAQPNISPKKIGEYEFYFPSKSNERNRITDIIETQFTRLGAAIKSLKTIKAKLELYRQGVLKAAFEGSLITDTSFKICTISDFCNKVRKIEPKKEKLGEFYYIDIGSIDNIRKRISAPNIIHSNEAPSRARQETLPGDILYSTVRVYLKNLAIVPELLERKIISSTGFTVLRPNERLNSRYLFYYLLSDNVTRMLNAKQRGTSYPAIRDNDVFDSPIPIPGTEVQEEIVAEIESRFSVIDKLEETVTAALLKAERLRKSILKSAFEGELV